jgi:N-acetylglucosaminyldiphosphoundecaprenol N-acetyl-beta-D-mannosaminyltransferase
MSSPTFDVLGIPVAVTNLQDASARLVKLAVERKPAFFTARDVHGVMLAQQQPALLAAHQRAEMNLPDGMPLVMLGRLRKLAVSRVAGPDFVIAACRAGVPHGLRHFFYGGNQGVAELMAANLASRIPGLIVAGAESPPMGLDPLDYDQSGVEAIVSSNADVVWLGLSTPKQEYWMNRHVEALNGASIIGVGAAFDIHAGHLDRPPRWVQRSGFEWAYRLLKEPNRLWRRYLILAPRFVFLVGTAKLRRRT